MGQQALILSLLGISFLFFSQAKSSSLGRALQANLSACYPSFTDANRPAYCCPPIKDGDQKLHDFDVTKLSKAKLRVRRPVHRLDDAYIAKYKKAVAMMKSLPSDHPHSFVRQAGNHCLYCTGSYDQKNSKSLFKIHRSWLFFPWHRAFLFFHERILGKLIGDESFALPYWSWDSPEGMQIPRIYTEDVLSDTYRDETHLPPTVAELNYDYIVRNRTSDEQIAENLAFMYTQMVSGAKKKELFLGCRLTAGEDGFCDGPGTVEAAPHNTLHSWVGSGHNVEREDMGAFYSAARDPIFYGHHGNIDRLWEVWKQLRGGHDTEFADPAWHDTAFTFYDENLKFVRIRVRDLMSPAELGYAYEEIPLPWLDAKPKPTVTSAVSRERIRKRESLLKRREVLERERALLSAVTVEVSRSRIGRSKEEKEREEEVLVVEGIRVKRDEYAKFDVFVNFDGDVEKSGPLVREFAGSFVSSPHGVKRRGERNGMREKGTTLKIGISELLDDIGADGDETIWVTLVPRGGSGDYITFEGVRIEFMR